MRLIRAAGALALLCIGLSRIAAAACNLGDDAPKFTLIKFGRLSLSGFSEGSLTLSNQAGLGDADRWDFKLAPANNEIDVKVSGADSLGVTGRLHLVKPIMGHLTERHLAGHCSRTIEFDNGTFSNSRLLVAKLNTSNTFGGRILAADVTADVIDNDELSDSQTATKGRLVLLIPQMRVEGASITFPSANDTALGVSLTQTSPALKLEISTSTLSAAIVNGTLQSLPVRISPTEPIPFAGAGLQAQASAISAQMVRVDFVERAPRLSFSTVVISAASASHPYPLPVTLSGITRFRIAAISGQAALQDGRLVTRAATVRIEGGKIEAAKIATGWGTGSVSVDGPGSLSITSMTATSVDADEHLDSPKFAGATIANYAFAMKAMTLKVKGLKTSPILTGNADLSLLELGSMRVSGATLPVSFSGTPQGDIAVAAKGRALSAMLGSLPGDQLQGTLANFDLSGKLHIDPAAAELQFLVPALGMRASATLAPQPLNLFGGSVAITDRDIKLQNLDAIKFSRSLDRGTVDFGPLSVSIAGFMLAPQMGQPLFNTMAEPVSKRADDVSFNLVPNDPMPLRLKVAFELPGFSITPPAPLHSVAFDVGNLNVEVVSFHVDKFRVDLTDSVATLSLIGVSIGLEHFKTRAPKPGERPIQPDIAGLAATPLALDSVAGDIRIRPAPVAMAEFDLYGASWAATQLIYRAPDDLVVKSTSGTISLGELKMPQPNEKGVAAAGSIKGTVDLRGSSVLWSGAPNGEAAVDEVKAVLIGDPQKPNGSIVVQAPRIAISGRADVPLGTEPDGHNGCQLVVPANVILTVRDVSGTLDLQAGRVSGYLSTTNVDEGNIKYSGHQDCRWEQLVKLGKITITHPCIGTLSWNDFVRSCSEEIDPSFTVGMVFVVKLVDLNIKPATVKFRLEQNGQFGACYISIDRIWQNSIPIYSIAAQIPLGGDGAHVVNDLISVGTGAVESTLTSGLLDLYSLMNLAGFGRHNPVKNDC